MTGLITSFKIDTQLIKEVKNNTAIDTKDLNVNQIATLYALNFNLWQNLTLDCAIGFELANKVYTQWKNDNETDNKIIRFMLNSIVSFLGLNLIQDVALLNKLTSSK
jgi:hypothetical protein